jgi:sugar/nucleoside kinase (ribokinase family)
MRVACCGLTTLDVVHYTDRLPRSNEKVTATRSIVEFGGPAANAAFTASALGTPTTLITALGNGPIADVTRAQLSGLDIVDAAPPGYTPPVSSVMVVGNDRAVVSRNAGQVDRYQPVDEVLAGCRAVLVDGHHLPLCLAVARQARAAEIPVLLDGGSWKPGLEQLLPMVDAAVLSADFAPEAVVDWGDRPTAVSHGAEPIRYGRTAIPVPQVAVVDTVGAGDVLHGALLVHLARHGLADFSNGLQYAARIASESCRYPGAHAWASGSATTGT